MTSPEGGDWASPPWLTPCWPPSQELLAAYFDGEFEGRDDLVPLRRRLEEWLAHSPRDRAELLEHRRLRRLWIETTPPDPPSASWQNVKRRLENRHSERIQGETGALSHPPFRPRPSSWRTTSWKAAGLLVGAACILFGFILFEGHTGAPSDDEPFPVASEREVVILQVEGADTGTLVVGELPVQGPLELVGPGDVTLTSVEPAERDNMVPEINVAGPGRPIIWARAEAEED